MIQKIIPVALTVAVAFAGISMPAMANKDAQGKPGNRAEWQAKKAAMKQKFTQELNLTEEQQAKIEALRKNFRETHKADFEKMRARMKELKAEKKAGNLSKEEMKARHQAMKQEFAGLHEAGKALREQIKAVLTPEQQAKLESMKADRKQRWQEKRQEKSQKEKSQKTQ